MEQTSWFLADLDTNYLARAYEWMGSYYRRRPWWGGPHYPAYQLKSSAVELAQFLTTIVQYGELDTVRILDSTTVELILSHQFEVGTDWWIGLVWHHVGWLFEGRWVWCHNGAGDGVDVVMGFCPDENSAVIALANCENYGCSWTVAEALLDYAEQYAVEETTIESRGNRCIGPTVFSGPLLLPEGKNCRVFDVMGRVVAPDKTKPGIYFIEVEGKIARKVVKVR
jgi:hypothetical protein